MEKDPVCGMEIKDISKAEKLDYKAKTYYFCTTLCRIQFEIDPEKYLSKDSKDDHSKNKH